MNIELKSFQYKRMLEERRGHNYQYPNNEKILKNDKLGYIHHKFSDYKTDTISEQLAIDIVNYYRLNGYYARIVCYSNEIIGTKYYSVIYRKK